MGAKKTIKIAAAALKAKLAEEYQTRFTVGGIPDSKSIPNKDWKNDVSKWTLIDLGNIFSYILKHKEFDSDYIGKYKSEKAYSYFDSKCVATVLCSHMPDSGKIVF